MAYRIKDERTDALLRRLARIRRRPMAEVLRETFAEAVKREESKLSVAERLEPLRAKLRGAGVHRPVDSAELKRLNDEDAGEPL
jgi:hypothetical protein